MCHHFKSGSLMTKSSRWWIPLSELLRWVFFLLQMLRQNTPVQDLETGIIRTPGRHFWYGILSTIFLESFTLTFLAEWGDRSQIATIILGAREVGFVHWCFFYVWVGGGWWLRALVLVSCQFPCRGNSTLHKWLQLYFLLTVYSLNFIKFLF